MPTSSDQREVKFIRQQASDAAFLQEQLSEYGLNPDEWTFERDGPAASSYLLRCLENEGFRLRGTTQFDAESGGSRWQRLCLAEA